MYAKLFVVAALALTINNNWAAASCFPNSYVQGYISAHKFWSIVDVVDLPADDKMLWERQHAGLCPGIAVVNLDGGGKSYALALLHRSKGATLEKLVLLKRTRSRFQKSEIRGAFKIITPFVIWGAAPGIFVDRISGKSVKISHESVIFEKMEATSTQYYFSNGGLQSLVSSD